MSDWVLLLLGTLAAGACYIGVDAHMKKKNINFSISPKKMFLLLIPLFLLVAISEYFNFLIYQKEGSAALFQNFIYGHYGASALSPMILFNLIFLGVILWLPRRYINFTAFFISQYSLFLPLLAIYYGKHLL